jgi:hypothetical protein
MLKVRTSSLSSTRLPDSCMLRTRRRSLASTSSGVAPAPIHREVPEADHPASKSTGVWVGLDGVRIPMNSAIDSSSTAPMLPIQTRHRFRSASATHFPCPCSHASSAELSEAAGGHRLRRTHDRSGGQLMFSARDACLRWRCQFLSRARSMSAMCRVVRRPPGRH